MWQPDNRQWIVIALTFLAGGLAWLAAAEAGPRGGEDELTVLALLLVICGVLVVWFLQGRPKLATPADQGKKGSATPKSFDPKRWSYWVVGALLCGLWWVGRRDPSASTAEALGQLAGILLFPLLVAGAYSLFKRSEKRNTGRVFFWAALLIVPLSVLGRNAASTSELQELATEVTERMSLPTMVDTETEWSSVTADGPGRLTYRYRLVNVGTDAAQEWRELFVQTGTEEELLAEVCTTPSYRDLIDSGVTIRYVYVDRDGNRLFVTDINLSDCGG